MFRKSLKKFKRANFVFTDKFFKMKLLRLDGCFTVTLGPWESISHLYHVLYCYQTICDCKRNIMSSTNRAYSEKSICKLLSGFPFKPFLWSLAKKFTHSVTANCFILPPLIFATQNLMSLQLIRLCINLLSQSLWTLYIEEVVNKNLNL